MVKSTTWSVSLIPGQETTHVPCGAAKKKNENKTAILIASEIILNYLGINIAK